ncbi:MAG: glycosyltransferase family 29 protein [Actinobacteria bacterium]|nr:glycosyltransferase family 29 protein [Actinomycetota bacterium]MBE3114641.1 glycosyltransferase family 29 protein [Actinomycetota bacterium]
MIDKSVIIVGNGSILKSQKLGKRIDEFDEVVRINDWKTKGFEEIAGSKTTIWVMYNPIKNCGNFISGYKTLGLDIDSIKDIVKDLNEIWFVCWNEENLSYNWKQNGLIKELGIYDKTKRHLSIKTSRKISSITNPPSTGFSLIWILTHMYDKIYLTGFDFGNQIPTEGTFNHYYGSRTKEFVEKNNIHNLEFEMEYVKKLKQEGKIDFLIEDTNINKGKFIENTSKVKCRRCGKLNYLYDWEQRVCNYCERMNI